MFRSRLCLLLSLCMLGTALAESPSLISEEMIRTETVNYAKTAVVEKTEYRRDYSASAAEYYPYTYTVAPEIDNASFLEYHVSRSQQVKEGDLLATFSLNVDEAACTSARLALKRAQENYAAGKQKKREEIEELLEDRAGITDPYEREMMTLRTKRAQIAYEQYCCQQEYAIEQLADELAELEKENSSCYLYAPCDGTVTEVAYKRKGERVYAGEGLITLYREEGMLLRISNDQLYFRYGMPVTVTAGSKTDPQTFTGRVVAADNVLPASRRLGYAFIELEPFETGEKPRLVRLNVNATSEYLADILVIPRRAVTMDAGKYYVECVVNGTLQKRCINAGLMNMSGVWATQGLEAGETILID